MQNLVETTAVFNIASTNWSTPLSTEQNETLMDAVASALDGLPQNYQIALGTVMVSDQIAFQFKFTRM